MAKSVYNSTPHLDYYAGQDELPIEEVAEKLIVKYGGDFEALKEYFRQLLNEELLEAFDEMIDVQTTGTSWREDPYMHGMANGMIFMKSLVDGEEPQYLSLTDPRRHVAGFEDFVELALEGFDPWLF